jgi:hypothetical protein
MKKLGFLEEISWLRTPVANLGQFTFQSNEAPLLNRLLRSENEMPRNGNWKLREPG